MRKSITHHASRVKVGKSAGAPTPSISGLAGYLPPSKERSFLGIAALTATLATIEDWLDVPFTTRSRPFPARSKFPATMRNPIKAAVLAAGSFCVGVLVAQFAGRRAGDDAGQAGALSRSSLENQRLRTRPPKATSEANDRREATKLGRLSRALEIARNSQADPRSVIASLRAAGQLDEDFCRAIFAQWAALDPAEAMEFANQPQNRDIQRIAAETILEAALDQSPDEVIGLLKSLPASGTGEMLVGGLFLKWAATDLAGLEKALQGIESPYLKKIALSSLIGRLGEVDPMAGLERIANMKGAERDMALSSLMIGWARQDARAAAEHVMSMGSGNMPPEVIAGLVSTWSQSDPVAALDFALGLKGGTLRSVALNNLVVGVAGGTATPAEIAELVGRVPAGKARDELLTVFLYNWRGDDFKSIAAPVYGEGSGIVGSIAEGTLAKKWVESDYQGAKSYFESVGDAADRSALGRELLLQGIRLDPGKNLAVFSEMSAKNGSGWTATMMDQLIKSDPAAAIAAMDHLENSGSPLSRTAFVNSYAMYEPEKTMQWITSAGFKGSADEAARVAMRRWTEIDEYAASEFVRDMPPSEMRDASASVIAESSAQSGDIKSALAWALSIKDDTLRRNGLAAIGRSIDHGDSGKYSQEILDSGISDEEIKYLKK
jgi:hypothetical protein